MQRYSFFSMKKEKRQVLRALLNIGHKEKLLHWAHCKYDTFLMLNTNGFKDNFGKFEWALAVGVEEDLICRYEKGSFQKADDFQKRMNDWIFGHFTYDLKNEVEQLYSKNMDGILFPILYLFQPQKIFFIKQNALECHFLNSILQREVLQDFKDILNTNPLKINVGKCFVQSKFSKAEYLNRCNQIIEHIGRGDIYEVNFCQEFFVENTEVSPIALYKKLNRISKTPQSCFYRLNDHFLISASPERFLQKTGNRIIAQPIKGNL